MDSTIISSFLPNDRLPSHKEIEEQSLQTERGCSGMAVRQHPDGPIVAWVKFNTSLTLSEALTQDWVARSLAADPTSTVRAPRVYDFFTVPRQNYTMRYIVMEYVDLPDCEPTRKDGKLVAKAVERLIHVPPPPEAMMPGPGPVGGGSIIHYVFDEFDSQIQYESVLELEEHVNNILKLMKVEWRVAFGDRQQLLLCPYEIQPENFKKDIPNEESRDVVVWALDFYASPFLPPAFLAFSFGNPISDFAGAITQYCIKHSSHLKSIWEENMHNITAMAFAHYFLLSRRGNRAGVPQSIYTRMQSRRRYIASTTDTEANNGR